MSNNYNYIERRRYDSFDTYKTIAALWIICLHGKLPGIISGEFCALARTAVPFFFMVSGFFSCKADCDVSVRQRARRKKIKKYLSILVGITLVYTGYYFLLVCTNRISMESFLSNFDLSFWLMHFNSISGHLWFVRALIYMEIIFLFFEPLFAGKKGIVFSVVLWVSDVMLFKYSEVLFHMTIPEPYFEILTKFFGSAMVYYILGYQFKKNEDKILYYFGKMAGMAGIFAGCLLVILNLAEYHVVTVLNINQMPANYISTFFVSLYIFGWLLANRDFGRGSLINEIGKEYSMHIYYWHLMVIFLSGIVYRIIGIPDVIYLNPLLVFCETLIIVIIVKRMRMMLERSIYGKKN